MRARAANDELGPTLEYVDGRYETLIGYYWTASARNKRAYKWSRYATVVLGALVTLLAALSSSAYIQDSPGWAASFALATPVVAALLAILNGFSQSFYWGAAWREMVLSAERLEKQRDLNRVLPVDERDPSAELAFLNDVVMAESEGFFGRIVGRAQSKPKDGG